MDKNLISALQDIIDAIENSPEYNDAMISSGYDIDVIDAIEAAKQVLRVIKLDNRKEA